MSDLQPISFYQDGNFVVVQQWSRYVLYADAGVDPFVWLEEIEQRFYTDLKLLKINFDLAQFLFLETMAKTNSPLIEVIVAHEFEILGETQLEHRFHSFHQTPCHFLSPFQMGYSQSDYIARVEQILKRIQEGDYYQINFTTPFTASYQGSPLTFFWQQRKRFQGDYHALFPSETGTLVSFSPELFLERRGGSPYVVTAPIKGTAPNTPDEITRLLDSSKERAELSMIVDLLRNDLNLLSTKGDEVLQHRSLMTLNNLVHTFSKVAIESDLSLPKILKVTFPGGSISGCPKSSAVSAIYALEKYPRDFYTGILGWWQQEQFCLNILIRSFFFHESGTAYYHAGGGIVAESVAAHEYAETCLKAAHLAQF